MPLKVLRDDQFEDRYTAKFRTMASDHGIVIHYERDRAATDLGVHLVAGDTVTNVRVWFQFKGIHATSLPLDKYNEAREVSHSINIEHLRHWYQAAEATYLVVYVESADTFLAEDVRSLINRKWGMKF